jgi:hypothetical protein
MENLTINARNIGSGRRCHASGMSPWSVDNQLGIAAGHSSRVLGRHINRTGVVAENFPYQQRVSVAGGSNVEVRRLSGNDRHAVVIPPDLRDWAAGNPDTDADWIAFVHFQTSADGLEEFRWTFDNVTPRC